MRTVGLISGGKDSVYSLQLAKQHGHDVVALANLLPEASAPDELDSFCFQTVGHQLVGAYAACMGLPLFRKHISGTSSVQDLSYSPTDGDEVEDLFQLLAFVKDNVPGVQAVATGAIASDYQRLRVENVCSRLNLVSLAYLWHQPQRVLLRNMVESGMEAILVKVACLGLQPRKHLGRSIAAMEPVLHALSEAYGCNVCGEGGEYETLALDSPLFTRGRIVLDDFQIEYNSGDVGHLVPTAFRVVPKAGWEGFELPSDVRMVPHDYVAPQRFRAGAHCCPAPGPAAPVTPAAASTSASPSGTSIAAAAAAAAAALDPLLQPLPPPTFTVHVSMCLRPDYVQLVCRATRTRTALASEVTESDTTAALHTLLTVVKQELAAHHMDLHHCLFVHLFLANMGHFQAANGVYCKHFPGRDPPSRACVQVCLPQECPVMCEFLLARGAAPPMAQPSGPPPQHVVRHTRRVLHVQSISSWAPSCIGPYSQATSYRGLVFMAGVIPLEPPTMTIVPGDITAQVLRAMASCEAVAVAQRTTVVGAALGLTVYLAATAGAAGCGGGGGGGAGSSCSGGPGVERSAGSGGGAEQRALARSALEALLEHGLPGYNFASTPRSALLASPGPGSGVARYNRASATELGVGTPRGSQGASLFAPASAPRGRGPIQLGADGLDEEEEEAAAAAAAAAASVGSGPGSLSGQYARASANGYFHVPAPVGLDPYLQPPEVRCTLRPSIVYVTVPSLPRGSLVELQPVCMDVEALSVLKRLQSHDSLARKRTSSHVDTSALAQASGASGSNGLAGAGTGSAGGAPPAGGGATTTAWSDMPPTPRGSLESSTSGSGRQDSAIHGSIPMPWQVSSEGLGALNLPSHMLPSAGFMSPEAGSAVGTPSAGPSMLARQRSSGLVLTPYGGSNNGGLPTGPAGLGSAFSRLSLGSHSSSFRSDGRGEGSLSGPTGAGSQSALSAPGSNRVLMSPTLQQQLQGQASATDLALQGLPGHGAGSAAAAGRSGELPDAPTIAGAPREHSASQPAPVPRPRVSSSGGAGYGPGPGPAGTLSAPGSHCGGVVAAAAAGALNSGCHSHSHGHNHHNHNHPVSAREALGLQMGAPPRASYSGSSSSSGHVGSLVHRNSLDGNILSFEVCPVRAPASSCAVTGPGHVVMPLLPSPLPQPMPHAPLLSSSVPAAPMSAGSGSGGSFTRARPAAITVPPLPGHAAVTRAPAHAPVTPSAPPSPFEKASGGIAACAAVVDATGVASGGPGLGPSIAPVRVAPAASSSFHGSHFSSAAPTPTAPGAGTNHTVSPVTPAQLPTGPLPPPAGSPAPPAAGPAPSSDVMVTTVQAFGQVLRMLFHLPPGVFAPGVTTAQLTRRFRRAAASMLAAHNMDMTCVVWARVWYERDAVVLNDDEYEYYVPPTGPLSAHEGGVLHVLDDEEDVDERAAAVAAASAAAAARQRRAHRHAGASDGGAPGTSPRGAGVSFKEGHGSGNGNNVRSTGAVGSTSGLVAAAAAALSASATAPSAAGAGAGGALVGSCSGSPLPSGGKPLSQLSPGGLPPPSPQLLSPLPARAGGPGVGGSHASGPADPHHHGPLGGPHAGAQPPSQLPFHVAWVPVMRVSTNASPPPAQCVAVLELLAAASWPPVA